MAARVSFGQLADVVQIDCPARTWQRSAAVATMYVTACDGVGRTGPQQFASSGTSCLSDAAGAARMDRTFGVGITAYPDGGGGRRKAARICCSRGAAH